jgi:hypothetical protein
VLGVGVVLFVVAAVGYAVTRSGVRVTSHVPIGVVDEVLLGLGLLLLSGLIVLCGGVAAALNVLGLSPSVGWPTALVVTLAVAGPAAKRTWAAADHQVELVQAKRNARVGRPPSAPTSRGRHQR